jgi:hypothetical protein
MKFVFISLFLLTLGSCCSSRKATESTVEKTEETKTEVMTEIKAEIRYVGTVRVSESGCPLWIEVKDSANIFNVYPVNLDDKFKNDGMRLRFNMITSRAPQPTGCSVQHAVVVSEVTLLRENK